MLGLERASGPSRNDAVEATDRHHIWPLRATLQNEVDRAMRNDWVQPTDPIPDRFPMLNPTSLTDFHDMLGWALLDGSLEPDQGEAFACQVRRDLEFGRRERHEMGGANPRP